MTKDLPLRQVTALLVVGIAACGGGSSGGGASAVKTWSTPERISFELGNVGTPALAVASNGNAIAIFRDHDGSWGATVNQYVPGSGWEQPQRISTTPADSAAGSDADIAVAPSGEVVAVWVQRPDSSTDTSGWSNYRVPAGGWAAPRLLESSPQAVAGTRIALDPTGAGTAVWVEFAPFPGTDDDVFISNYTPGGNWGFPLSIDGMTTEIRGSPAIAADASGRVYVTWSQGVGSGTSLFAAFSAGPTSAIWTRELVDTFSPPAVAPDIAVNAAGTAFLVWQQTEVAGNVLKIWARRRPNSNSVGAWEAQQRIDLDTGGDASSPRVAVDASGNAIAVWAQSGGIWSNRFTAGAGWGTAQKIDVTSNGTDGPRLAVRPNGDAIAVWQHNDTSKRVIWAAHFQPQSGWAPPVRLYDQPNMRAFSPVVAFDGSGNAVAVWPVSDPAISGVSKIWASQFR